jgi:hypothetical protein
VLEVSFIRYVPAVLGFADGREFLVFQLGQSRKTGSNAPAAAQKNQTLSKIKRPDRPCGRLIPLWQVAGSKKSAHRENRFSSFLATIFLTAFLAFLVIDLAALTTRLVTDLSAFLATIFSVSVWISGTSSSGLSWLIF